MRRFDRYAACFGHGASSPAAGQRANWRMFALAGLALCALPDYMESFDRNGIAQYQKVGADPHRKSLTTFLGPARREFSHKLGPAAEDHDFLHNDRPQFFRAASRHGCYRAGRVGGSAVNAWRVAGVAELVDAPDLGSGGENRGGSSPSARTKP